MVSKFDQGASDPRSLHAVNAVICGQGLSSAADILWIALIGQSVSIQATHSNGENSSDSARWVEVESLKSIVRDAPSAKVRRIALVCNYVSPYPKSTEATTSNSLSGYGGLCKSHAQRSEFCACHK